MDAKSHFTEWKASAAAGEPVAITRRGKAVAAIVRVEDLATLNRQAEVGPQAGLAGIMRTWEDEGFAETLDEIVASRGNPRKVSSMR
jgi:antitoxin (DNA-binding transcriptional repressor) of toxin-antitoxin stability system